MKSNLLTGKFATLVNQFEHHSKDSKPPRQAMSYSRVVAKKAVSGSPFIKQDKDQQKAFNNLAPLSLDNRQNSATDFDKAFSRRDSGCHSMPSSPSQSSLTSDDIDPFLLKLETAEGASTTVSTNPVMKRKLTLKSYEQAPAKKGKRIHIEPDQRILEISNGITAQQNRIKELSNQLHDAEMNKLGMSLSLKRTVEEVEEQEKEITNLENQLSGKDLLLDETRATLMQCQKHIQSMKEKLVQLSAMYKSSMKDLQIDSLSERMVMNAMLGAQQDISSFRNEELVKKLHQAEDKATKLSAQNSELQSTINNISVANEKTIAHLRHNNAVLMNCKDRTLLGSNVDDGLMHEEKPEPKKLLKRKKELAAPESTLSTWSFGLQSYLPSSVSRVFNLATFGRSIT
ncbi:hypothetical protein [Endozoicomonas ascidiicola]|uniref:hypothetical protein n=1 Tax=Endozoicomonas ascidiicola TaxID=1698521 RepID=UPI000834F773|nr:hypothetical protein [Endozoicomonas ascidiicola]